MVEAPPAATAMPALRRCASGPGRAARPAAELARRGRSTWRNSPWPPGGAVRRRGRRRPRSSAVPLSRLAEWHSAAWLTLLRARLLLPDLPAGGAGRGGRAAAAPADREAARRLPMAGAAAAARAGGLRRPASRSRCRRSPAADLRAAGACLSLLELPPRQRVYRPHPPPLWRVPDALARMRWAADRRCHRVRRWRTFLPAPGRAGGFDPAAAAGRPGQHAGRWPRAQPRWRGRALSQDAAFGDVGVVRPGDAEGLRLAERRRMQDIIPIRLNLDLLQVGVAGEAS